MRVIYIIELIICVHFSSADAASCEAGWAKYNDELCIKYFPTLSTYANAKTICSHLSGATLVMVKDAALHDYLVEYTQGIFDNIWLGGKYDEQSAQFKWDDGEPLCFTNWHEGYPRNITDPDASIELRPANVKHSATSDGSWADATGQKRNAVMYQRASSWSLEDSVKEVKGLRKQHQEDVNQLLDILRQTEWRLTETIEIQQGHINELQENLGQAEQRLAEATSNLNSLKEMAITDLRFTGKEDLVTCRHFGSPDTQSYVITGVTNYNSDKFIDFVHRRQIQKFTNGNWVGINFV